MNSNSHYIRIWVDVPGDMRNFSPKPALSFQKNAENIGFSYSGYDYENLPIFILIHGAHLQTPVDLRVDYYVMFQEGWYLTEEPDGPDSVGRIIGTQDPLKATHVRPMMKDGKLVIEKSGSNDAITIATAPNMGSRIGGTYFGARHLDLGRDNCYFAPLKSNNLHYPPNQPPHDVYQYFNVRSIKRMRR